MVMIPKIQQAWVEEAAVEAPFVQLELGLVPWASAETRRVCRVPRLMTMGTTKAVSLAENRTDFRGGASLR